MLGISGTDVSAVSAYRTKGYKKPKVGALSAKDGAVKTLPTTDTFTDPVLGKQWNWNHNPKEAAWSLMESPGSLRLHTASVASELSQAQGTLTQRIFSYNRASTAANAYPDSYGTIALDTHGMTDGDVAGLCVFQDPYGYVGVKQADGKKHFVQYRFLYEQGGTNVAAEEIIGEELTADKVYLRAIANMGTNKVNFYYSYDNATWTHIGKEMTMRYTLKVFVGNRFGLFNYATKQLGGYVDFDWFSTEPTFTEERFYGEDVLKSYTADDLTVAEIEQKGDTTLLTGDACALRVTARMKSGLKLDITGTCSITSSNPGAADIVDGRLVTKKDGEANITIAYTDFFGNTLSTQFHVTVSTFPLTASAFNPSIWTNGSFDEATGTLITGKYGFGGWQYPSGVNLSAYNYVVVKLKSSSTAGPSFRLFDENSYWSSPCKVDFGSSTVKTISLHNAKKDNGAAFDPSHVYIAGFCPACSTHI